MDRAVPSPSSRPQLPPVQNECSQQRWSQLTGLKRCLSRASTKLKVPLLSACCTPSLAEKGPTCRPVLERLRLGLRLQSPNFTPTLPPPPSTLGCAAPCCLLALSGPQFPLQSNGNSPCPLAHARRLSLSPAQRLLSLGSGHPPGRTAPRATLGGHDSPALGQPHRQPRTGAGTGCCRMDKPVPCFLM